MDEQKLAAEMNTDEWLRHARRAAHVNAARETVNMRDNLWLQLANTLDEIRASKIENRQILDQFRTMGIEVDPAREAIDEMVDWVSDEIAKEMDPARKAIGTDPAIPPEWCSSDTHRARVVPLDRMRQSGVEPGTIGADVFITRETAKFCCQREAQRTAHDSGDGWALGWECKVCGEQYTLDEWPFDKGTMTPAELRRYGYEVV